MAGSNEEYTVSIVGEPKVGKTSVLLQYVDQVFVETGCEFQLGLKIVSETLADGSRVKLNVWDTLGQERDDEVSLSTRPPKSKGKAHAIVIMFDLTDKNSFQHARSWLTRLSHGHAGGLTCDGDVLKVLVGNKSDLVAERALSKEEVAELARSNQLLCFESSAKDFESCSVPFRQIAEALSERKRNSPPQSSTSCGVQ